MPQCGRGCGGDRKDFIVSVVTSLLMSVGREDARAGAMEEVNRYFEERDQRGLVSLSDPALPRAWYGGTKYMEADVYVGAFDYLNLERFLGHVRGVAWREPERVQLIVKEQEDYKFRIVAPFKSPPPGGLIAS
jgi:hypothetical protein